MKKYILPFLLFPFLSVAQIQQDWRSTRHFFEISPLNYSPIFEGNHIPFQSLKYRVNAFSNWHLELSGSTSIAYSLTKSYQNDKMRNEPLKSELSFQTGYDFILDKDSSDKQSRVSIRLGMNYFQDRFRDAGEYYALRQLSNSGYLKVSGFRMFSSKVGLMYEFRKLKKDRIELRHILETNLLVGMYGDGKWVEDHGAGEYYAVKSNQSFNLWHFGTDFSYNLLWGFSRKVSLLYGVELGIRPRIRWFYNPDIYVSPGGESYKPIFVNIKLGIVLH